MTANACTYRLEGLATNSLDFCRLPVVDTLIAKHIHQLSRNGVIHGRWTKPAKVGKRFFGMFDIENTGPDGGNHDGELLVKAHVILFV